MSLGHRSLQRHHCTSVRIKVFVYFSTDTSCSSKALVRRLYCQGRGRVTPSHPGRCTPLHPGPSLAAAWPDHCLPSTSRIAVATGSARPCQRHSSLSPWLCCSHTSSVSYKQQVREDFVCSEFIYRINIFKMLDKQGNWETAEFKKTESIKEIQKQTLLHIKNAAGIKQYKKPHKNQKEEGKKKNDRCGSKSDCWKCYTLTLKELAFKAAGNVFQMWPSVGNSEILISCPAPNHR